MKLAWLALLAGCYQPAGEHSCAITCPCPAGLTCGNDGLCHDSTGGCGSAMPDAPVPDGTPDAPPVCVQGSQGSYFSGVCVENPGVLALNGPIDTSMPCMPVAAKLASYCVEYGTVVTMSNVTATGARPLLVIATDTLAITGTVDVSSDHFGRTGAAANTGPCGLAGDGTNAADGGGGGAGGSFGGIGGDGGAVNGGGGGGAAPRITTAPAQLVGGCRGGIGSTYAGSGSAAAGSSGGALYLMAQNQITLASGTLVVAMGAGGGGGTQGGGGGGGGGSGGMIVLDAMQINGCPPPAACLAVPIVAAHGGGGGGGGATALQGAPGNESTGLIAGAGGIGGVAGGAGSSDTASDGTAGTSSSPAGPGAGGGGGGGGDGFILTFAMSTSDITFSPAVK